nr:reverse transcriptase domain-containing protein [Tanacetum cinerariifolium]
MIAITLPPQFSLSKNFCITSYRNGEQVMGRSNNELLGWFCVPNNSVDNTTNLCAFSCGTRSRRRSVNGRGRGDASGMATDQMVDHPLRLVPMNVDHSVSKALMLIEPNNLDNFMDNDADDVLDDVSEDEWLQDALRKKEEKSTRAFVTRYTDDTLQILGFNEEHRISGYIHGLRTRSLVEFHSTDLSTTYKGLMVKTYTWIEAREVATNGTLNDHREGSDRFKENSSWDNKILATKKVAKTFEPPTCVLGSRRSRDMTKYYRFHEDHRHNTNDCLEVRHQIKEAVKSGDVNRVYMDSGSSCEVIYEHSFLKMKPSIKSHRTNSKIQLVGFLGELSWPIREVPLEITISNNPFLRTDTFNFIIVRDEEAKGSIFNGYRGHPQLRRHRRKKGRKPFNTEHKLNVYKHIKPIKQKNHRLGPDHRKVACKEVKDVMKVGIIQEVKNPTWVANPVMVKKADGGYRTCVDFTDINKAFLKDCYPLQDFD